MRPLQLKPKKHIKKIPKKKRKYTGRRGWNYSHHRITMTDMENINDVLCAHKSKLAQGKGAWKIVPKDSCEVYRERRKRKLESQNKEIGRDDEKSDRRRIQNGDDKLIRKKPVRKQKQRHNKKRCRHDSCSSSCTSRTVTESSYTSLSEMDYD